MFKGVCVCVFSYVIVCLEVRGMTSLPSERSLHTFVDALAYNPVLGWSHSLGACLLKVSETCSDW